MKDSTPAMDFRSLAKNRLLHLVALVLIGIVAGPEVGFGMEAVALLDAMGAELFLLAFGGVHIFFYWERTKRLFERFDPYFFVPTRDQIKQVPGVIAHAVPFLVFVMISGVVGSIAEMMDT